MENIDVFVRNEDVLQDDTWDDSVLIGAYNRSVNRIKNDIAKRLGIVNGTNEKKGDTMCDQKGDKDYKWKVGDFCRAVYSVDGLEYEAKILKLMSEEQCLVKYFGYENEEVVMLEALKKSLGKRSRAMQSIAAQNDGYNENDLNNINETLNNGIDIVQSGFQVPGLFQFSQIPPPPPLNILTQSGSIDSESDALSTMLMSWYMTGYHTGYYQGLMQSKKCAQKIEKK